MTAILLAAGLGKRMGAGASPKCLMSVGSRTLLQRTLETLRASGVSHVAIVVGYRAEEVVREARRHAAGLRLTILENPRYQEGAILSLHAARDLPADAVLIMDADVLFPQVVLERLLRSPHPNCLLVDRASVDSGEEQLVFGRGDRVLHITKRPTDAMRREMTVFGESVGFLKLSKSSAAVLHECVARRVQAGAVTIEHEQVYPELFQTVPVGFERIDGIPWTEIDTPEDLQRAERDVLPRWAPTPCLNRILARWFLPWVIRLPVTPNQWTLFSLGLGLAAAIAFADGRYGTALLGAILFQGFYVVDDWDGEVARARGLGSRFGGWFDVTVDAIVQTVMPLALAVGVSRSSAAPWILSVGWVAVMGFAMDFVVTMWSKALGFGPGVYGEPFRIRSPGHTLAGWVRVNCTNENFSLILLAAVALELRLPLLLLLAVGSHAFWILYVWRGRGQFFRRALL